MTSMLGAELGGLDSLAQRLGVTTSDIGSVETECRRIQASVCQEMQTAFSAAVGAIVSAMNELNSTVVQAQTELDGTNWTGLNQQNFVAGYGDFNAAMGSLQSAVNDAYSQFNAQMEQVAAIMEQFQASLGISMQDAQSSTTSMRQAVLAQMQNLDQVMNTGLSFS